MKCDREVECNVEWNKWDSKGNVDILSNWLKKWVFGVRGWRKCEGRPLLRCSWSLHAIFAWALLVAEDRCLPWVWACRFGFCTSAEKSPVALSTSTFNDVFRVRALVLWWDRLAWRRLLRAVLYCFTGLTTGSFHDQRHGGADPDILLTAADVENKAFSMLFVLFLWRLSRPINPREVRLGAARYFESWLRWGVYHPLHRETCAVRLAGLGRVVQDVKTTGKGPSSSRGVAGGNVVKNTHPKSIFTVWKKRGFAMRSSLLQYTGRLWI